MPVPYAVLWSIDTTNTDTAHKLEQIVHAALSQYRYSRAREFFECTEAHAIDTITTLAHRIGAAATPDLDLLQRLREADAREIAQREAVKKSSEARKQADKAASQAAQREAMRKAAEERALYIERVRQFNKILEKSGILIGLFVTAIVIIYLGVDPTSKKFNFNPTSKEFNFILGFMSLLMPIGFIFLFVLFLHSLTSITVQFVCKIRDKPIPYWACLDDVRTEDEVSKEQKFHKTTLKAGLIISVILICFIVWDQRKTLW